MPSRSFRRRLHSPGKPAAAALVLFSCFWPPNLLRADEESVTDSAAGGEEEIEVPELLGGSVAKKEPHPPGLSRISKFADWLWDLPVLVNNPKAPFLQEFRVTGRYHGQGAYVDSNRPTFREWETRRVRFGFNARILNELTTQIVWKWDDGEHSPDDSHIDNVWISWRRWDEFGIKIGHQKPLWSQEWSTSSNALLTFERSLLVNQLAPPLSLGAYFSGAVGHWAYGAGYYTDVIADGTETDAGGYFLVSLAHDFEEWFTYLEEARWRIDYFYNLGDDDPRSRHGLATSVSGKLQRWTVTSDILFATEGDIDEDIFGVTFTAAYYLWKQKIQFVGRIQYAWSSGDTLILQKRYETAGESYGDSRGDRYFAVYGGLNWYIRGNQFKLMGGLEYSRMRDSNDDGGDYNGWTFLAGIRISF